MGGTARERHPAPRITTQGFPLHARTPSDALPGNPIPGGELLPTGEATAMDADTRQVWWKGPRGEWWVAGQTALILALVLTRPGWTWGDPARRILATIGAALIVVGLAYAAAAVRALGPSLSPLPRPRRRAVLVQTGVYARTRHPIYGGLIVAAVGWALWRASGVHLALAVALALYLDAKARMEERWLLARFPDYAGYRARTRRLFPWVL